MDDIFSFSPNLQGFFSCMIMYSFYKKKIIKNKYKN